MRTVPVSIGKSRSFASLLSSQAVTKAKTAQQQRKELLDLADKYEGMLRRKLLEAINNIRDSVKLGQVAALLEAGASTKDIFAALGLTAADARLAAVIDTLGTAYRTAGITALTAAAAGVGGGPRVLVRFDSVSPGAVEYLRDRSASLVTAITQDTVKTIQDTLASMYGSGASPMAAARQLRDSIGLTAQQQQAVANYRAALQSYDYSALARNLSGNDERSIRAAFRARSLTPQRVNELVARYADRLLRYRTQVIAQTESFRAMNAANHEAWQQAIDGGQVDPSTIRRFWVSTNDSHTRESHREIPVLNDGGVAYDEPFKSPLGPIMYPGDPNASPSNSINCRCSVIIRFTNVPESALPPVVAGRSYLPGAADFVDQTGY